jgi:uncharacterized protein YoxC
MATITDIALLVIALSLLILILLLIRALMEIRRLAIAIRAILEKTQNDLVPMLSNLTAISARVKDASGPLAEGVSRFSDLLAAIGGGARTVRLVDSAIRSLLPSTFIGAASLAVGVKAGLAMLLNHWIPRRKGK